MAAVQEEYLLSQMFASWLDSEHMKVIEEIGKGEGHTEGVLNWL